MELLIRGIARAGGIEVPPDAKVVPSRPQRKARRNVVPRLLARGFHGLARRLERLGNRIAEAAAERRSAVPTS